MLYPFVVALTAVAFVSPPQEVASVTKRAARADVKAAVVTATAVRAPRAPTIDGRNDDESWRAAPSFSQFRQFEPKVVATRVDSLGWTAECRIPMSQLRYSSAATHTFGFAVWRDIERFEERT